MDYPSFDQFEYWFVYQNDKSWEIIDKKTNERIGWINLSGTTLYAGQPEDMFGSFPNWDMYKLRPEFKVGQPLDVTGNAESVKQSYEDLLRGVLMCRSYQSHKDPDKSTAYIEKILSWLKETDFYDAPASTIFHESFPHGLMRHSILVYNNMLELIEISKFKDVVNIDSAALCCLVHDWCKINLYQPFKKNVKNEQTGKWEQKDSYKRGRFEHPFGHGAASMWMATKMFNLNEEEALALRWHMSMFNVASNEINEYQQACEEYPLVHLLQFSDQLSITSY